MESIIKESLKTSIPKTTGRGGGGNINEGEIYQTNNGKVLIKENNNSKILFIGHSWISYLEEQYDQIRHNSQNHEIQFKRMNFPKFEDLPVCLERELKPNTTHILVFSIFKQAYYRLRFTNKPKANKSTREYSVTFPNTNYRAEDSLPTIKQMLLQIQAICPSAKLYIMIPSFPDLPYYNIDRNIEFAPTEVKTWYYSLPRSSAKHLYEDTHHVYRELMRLHTSDVKWSGKHTFALSEVIDLMIRSTKRNYKSLIAPNNDIYSLGSTGPLIDGIHPTPDFIEAFWMLIHNYNIFEKRNPSKKPLTTETNTDETPRPILVPHKRFTRDCKRKRQTQRFSVSHHSSFRSSPPSLLGSEENLASTSSGTTDIDRHISAHSYSTQFPKKRSNSPLVTCSKRLQTSISLPRPIQRMSLEQIDLIQDQFNIFAAYMMGITHLNTPNISTAEFEAMVKYFAKNFSLD